MNKLHLDPTCSLASVDALNFFKHIFFFFIVSLFGEKMTPKQTSGQAHTQEAASEHRVPCSAQHLGWVLLKSTRYTRHCR